MLFFPACRILLPAAERPCIERSRAGRRLLELKNIYRPAKTFKGIGHIRMWSDKGSLSARMALAGAAGGRIRVEILGFTGQPMATLMYDGKDYFFRSYTQGQTFEKSASPSAIRQLIGIDITTDDLVTLLAGGLPVREHDSVCREENGPPGEEILVLKDGWCSWTVEKLAVDFGNDRLRRMEMYGWFSLQYQMMFQDQRMVDGFLIPFKFILNDDQGNGLAVQMDRYWVNIPIKPGLFIREERP